MVLCAQEKRRLQEEIGAARRELEEEKFRVERLKVGGYRLARAAKWGVCVRDNRNLCPIWERGDGEAASER